MKVSETIREGARRAWSTGVDRGLGLSGCFDAALEAVADDLRNEVIEEIAQSFEVPVAKRELFTREAVAEMVRNQKEPGDDQER